MASGASSGPVNVSLTDDELDLLAAGLAEKKRPTVYLREAIPSLGLPEGSSARVVSISGRSLMVKPRGVDDELPFEAEEVRFTRKAPAPVVRKRAPRKAPAVKAPAVKAPAVKATAAKAPAVKAPAANAAPALQVPSDKVAGGAASNDVTSNDATKVDTPKVDTPRVESPRMEQPKPVPTKATRPRRGPVSVSVTIEGTADNEWTVSVMRGAKRVGKPSTVTADAVGRAMSSLGDEAASAEVSGLLDAARVAAEQRVAELARQLEEAQQTLKSLRPTK